MNNALLMQNIFKLSLFASGVSMKISELKPKQGNVDIVVNITEVGEIREFSKFGKPGRVATAVAKDDSGEIKLTLWNEQIDQVKVGDKVHIKDGYVNEWQGEKQLTTGRMGSLEVLPSAEKLVEEVTSTNKKEEKKPENEEPDDGEISEEEVKD
jgi:replication factor A1